MALVPPRGKMARNDQAFVWSAGVRVGGTSLWCDAPRLRDWCFVSRADLKVVFPNPAGARLIVSQGTCTLREVARLAQPDDPLTPLDGRPFAIGRLRCELLPSGYGPGSAQLIVETKERTVVYAGALNPLVRPTVEPAQVRACDALAIEAPLASWLEPLPPREPVEVALLEAVRAALDDQAQPVLLVPPLGVAGEVAALLMDAGVRVRATRTIAAWYALPVTGSGDERHPGALLVPHASRDAPAVKRLARARLLYVGEGALAPDAPARLGVHAAFPLSNYGDLPSILAHVVATGARDVYFTAGLTDEVASAFAARRLRVHALAAPAQLALSLQKDYTDGP